MEITEKEARVHYKDDLHTVCTTVSRKRLAALYLKTRGRQELVDHYLPLLERIREAVMPNDKMIGFGRFAMSNTEHRASRSNGGDVGWFNEDETPTDPWLAAIDNIGAVLTEPGQCSPVVVYDNGLLLVRVIGIEPRHERV